MNEKIVIRTDDGLLILWGSLQPVYRPGGTRIIAGWQVKVVCPWCGETHVHATGRPAQPSGGDYVGQHTPSCGKQDYHILIGQETDIQ